MNFSVAASDFDGTLFVNRRITKKNLSAIKNWRENGNKFGIVTGRAYIMLKPHLEEYKMEIDFAICENGAIIHDSAGEIVFQTEISKKILKEIVKEPLAVKSMHFAFESPEKVYCASVKPYSWVIREMKRWKFPVDIIEIDEIDNLPAVNQLALDFISQKEAQNAAQMLNNKYGEWIYAQKNTHSVDIVISGVNKAVGVENLLKIFDWRGKVHVIGDESNDLPMIRHFGGYTVSSAKDFVKRESKMIFESVGAMLDNFS